jgi:hypothetical protein
LGSSCGSERRPQHRPWPVDRVRVRRAYCMARPTLNCVAAARMWRAAGGRGSLRRTGNSPLSNAQSARSSAFRPSGQPRSPSALWNSAASFASIASMSSLDNKQRIALAADRALALGDGDLGRIEPDALVACHQRPRADERQLELLAGYTRNAIPFRGRRFGTGHREHPSSATSTIPNAVMAIAKERVTRSQRLRPAKRLDANGTDRSVDG